MGEPIGMQQQRHRAEITLGVKGSVSYSLARELSFIVQEPTTSISSSITTSETTISKRNQEHKDTEGLISSGSKRRKLTSLTTCLAVPLLTPSLVKSSEFGF